MSQTFADLLRSSLRYQWCTEFAPRQYKMFLSYCSGWLCSIGWQARFAAVCYMVAGIMQALIEHSVDNYEGNNRPQRALMGLGVALVVSAFNIFAAGHLSIAEGLFAICHVFALVPIITSLWILVTPKNSAWEALGHFVDNGKYITPPVSWPSPSLSTLVGQASSIVSHEQISQRCSSTSI